MKQEKLNKAYGSMSVLNHMRLPAEKAFAVYKLYKAMESPISFSLQEEKKYIEQFGGTVRDDGTITFDTIEHRAGFSDALNGLLNAEVNFDFEAVVLCTHDLDGQTISPADIMNLEGLVTFV